MMKAIIALISALLASGCLCCGTGFDLDDISDRITQAYDGDASKKTSGYESIECEPPYMLIDGECCPYGVCERHGEESLTTTTKKALTTTILAPKTTIAETTTTSVSEPTTTTLKKSHVYDCIRDLWSETEADGVFYFYSSRCGDKFTADASHVSIRTGVRIRPLNIGGYIDDRTLQTMECFYGTYYEGNPAFGQCPMLACPKTGQYKPMTGRVSAQAISQMSGFAKGC